MLTYLCASLLLGTRGAASWPGLSPRSQRLPLTSLGPPLRPRLGSFLSDTQRALAPPGPREGPPAAPHARAAPSLGRARGKLTTPAPPVRTGCSPSRPPRPLSVETKPCLVLMILVVGHSGGESVLRPPKISLDETQAPWKRKTYLGCRPSRDACTRSGWPGALGPTAPSGPPAASGRGGWGARMNKREGEQGGCGRAEPALTLPRPPPRQISPCSRTGSLPHNPTSSGYDPVLRPGPCV